VSDTSSGVRRNGRPDIADHLIESLNAARCKRWEETTANLDFTHSSRKCWGLIRRLGAAQQPAKLSRPIVSPNAVATHLVHVAKSPLVKGHERQVRNEWRQYCKLKISGETKDIPEPFQLSELESELKNVKSGTAADYDNILPEFLKHMGPKAKLWLTSFFICALQEKTTPQAWRQAKIIAIPKPGKDHSMAANYRPISLLSVCFKCLERLLLRRIKPTLELTPTP